MRRCVLIGAGEFKEKRIPLKENDFVIAVDGGYKVCLEMGIQPHLMVADFDSFKGDLIQDLEIVRSVPEKDDTDMLLAIHEGLRRGYDEFMIYGGMGGRIEHTFANIQCLKALSEKNVFGKLISGDCEICVISNRSISFDEKEEGYISVFSLTDKSIVSMEHLKYELDHYEMTSSYPIGAENEFIHQNSKITVHNGCICIIKNKE